MHSAKDRIINSVWRLFRKDKGKIFSIHLIYTALGMILFAPLLGVAGRFFLTFSGKEVLSDMDIALFILSPSGILALILFAALLITILAFEQATLMAVSAGRASGKDIAISSALRYTFAQSGRIYSFAARLILRILIITLPFLIVAAAVAWILITKHDINFYLAHKPPAFLATVAIDGVILSVMLYLLLRKLLSWSLALPLILFSDVSPSSSFASSEAVALGHKLEILKSFALWAVASLLLGFAALGSIHLLENILLPHFYDSLKSLAVVMGALLLLLTFVHFLVTTFTAGTFAALIVVLSLRYGSELGLHRLKTRADESNWKLDMPRILLLLLAAATAAIFSGIWLLNDVGPTKSIQIIAHRGAAGKAPENTLASIRQAIKDKTDWVEIDVQESKDGKVVVIHDSDFMKLNGVATKIWEGTFDELRRIDMGSWYDPRFSKERIPTLEEVLQEAKGKAKVMIELKYYGHDQKLEERVVKIVEANGMEKEVAVMSLKLEGVKKLHDLRPEWETGLLLSKAIGDISSMDVNYLAVNKALMKPSFVRRTHRAGKKLYVWTVDDPISMANMISLGVNGLITNEPEMGKKVLAEYAKLNAAQRVLLHAASLFGEPAPKRIYRDDSP